MRAIASGLSAANFLAIWPAVAVLPCADYPGFTAVVQAYLDTLPGIKPRHGAVAIANPIEGDWVRIFNDRGAFGARARVSDKARPGCVVAVSLWWRKLTADGRNVNELTHQRLTDIGRAPAFYDCLVEVEPAER